MTSQDPKRANKEAYGRDQSGCSVVFIDVQLEDAARRICTTADQMDRLSAILKVDLLKFEAKSMAIRSNRSALIDDSEARTGYESHATWEIGNPRANSRVSPLRQAGGWALCWCHPFRRQHGARRRSPYGTRPTLSSSLKTRDDSSVLRSACAAPLCQRQTHRPSAPIPPSTNCARRALA